MHKSDILTIPQTIKRALTLDARGRRIIRYALKRGGIRHTVAMLRDRHSMG